MSDQKIYQYLARRPDSRAQDIADILDVDLKVASDALRSLVDIGDVVRHTGTARNGHQAQLYNLSLTFKRTKQGQELMAAQAGMVDVEPAPVAAPVVVESAPKPPATAAPAVITPVFAQQTELAPVMTRVERAIQHLTISKTATDREIRDAMGLAADAAPRAYLASALKAGKVAKDGNTWRLGDGTPAPKQTSVAFVVPAQASSVSTVGRVAFGPSEPMGAPAEKVAAATRDEVWGIPTELKEQLSRAAQDLVAKALLPNLGPAVAEAPAPTQPPPESTFRCGLWSDGVLELQRDGRSLIELQRGEREQLADFMKRMLGAADQVAV